MFLKRHVKEKTIVAFYNGLRLPGLELEDVDWEDRGYRIMVGEDARMDIPEAERSTSVYRASLGHKIQHSFSPNCEFWEVMCHVSCVSLDSIIPSRRSTPCLVTSPVSAP